MKLELRLPALSSSQASLHESSTMNGEWTAKPKLWHGVISFFLSNYTWQQASNFLSTGHHTWSSLCFMVLSSLKLRPRLVKYPPCCRYKNLVCESSLTLCIQFEHWIILLVTSVYIILSLILLTLVKEIDKVPLLHPTAVTEHLFCKGHEKGQDSDGSLESSSYTVNKSL